ncbi:MAG: hypothetical protein ACODAB_06335 [Gemmatimonadota bacterium]
MSNHTKWIQRVAGVVVLGGAVAIGAGACDAVDNLLSVENPAEINEDELTDPQYAEILVNSVVAAFQDMYDDPYIWRGSMFTDEQITGINWEQTARLSQRIVRFEEGPADFMFSQTSAARMMADTVAGRFSNGLIENPNSDERMALVLAYGGYSYIALADVMCEAPVNEGPELGSVLHGPVALYEMAVDRFEDAIDIAQAAGREDIENLARVGAARALLNIGGRESEVMAHAEQVPEDFEWWVEYQINAGTNTLYSRTHGGNHSLGVHPRFLNGEFGENELVDTQTDPRIQHTPDWSTGHNQLTKLYKPYQGIRFSEYSGATVADGDEDQLMLPERDTDIQLASGLEALHHYYEAAGPDAGAEAPAGTTLEFVNARRAYGNQPALADPTDEELMHELRNQRARDTYLGGFRLGDLRRYERQGVNDPMHSFPSGQHPTEQWGQYGDATCFPLPLEEYEGNPNLDPPSG